MEEKKSHILLALDEQTAAALLAFASAAVRTRSYSDQEEDMVRLALHKMQELNYDEAYIDSIGNVVGRMGSGPTIVHFDSHLDTVEVQDAESWSVPPFSGAIIDGQLWGRGSVDMKSAFCAAVYAVALAAQQGGLQDKTVYVTGTVCEEYCDGENLKHFYRELPQKPDYCIICEPSDNIITLGHKGKAQIRLQTHGVSAHGSAPEKGVNAVYEMADIIKQIELLNQKLSAQPGRHGTIVLSDIYCVSASLNAVPSECTIYLDRRLAPNESLELVKKEMAALTAGKNASWEIGTLHHTTWKGAQLVYEPWHDPWQIAQEHPLTGALSKAWAKVYGAYPQQFDFWDFGTNAITPVALGIPTIGFGPGAYKLAHMRDEHIAVSKIKEACLVYQQLLQEL